jgi:hypothetical protein
MGFLDDFGVLGPASDTRETGVRGVSSLNSDSSMTSDSICVEAESWSLGRFLGEGVAGLNAYVDRSTGVRDEEATDRVVRRRDVTLDDEEGELGSDLISSSEAEVTRVTRESSFDRAPRRGLPCGIAS